MVPRITVLMLALWFSFAGGHAEAQNWFSPLTGIAVGPAGPPSSLVVDLDCCPSDSLKVTATKVVTESDSQWVLIGLVAQDKKVIKGVVVCYEVTTASPGSTYISTVRLSTMGTPDSATVVSDDTTNLQSTTPTCYTSNATTKSKVNGAVTLELQMVFGSTSDKIKIGGIKLF